MNQAKKTSLLEAPAFARQVIDNLVGHAVCLQSVWESILVNVRWILKQ